jgi:hypothetical protein
VLSAARYYGSRLFDRPFVLALFFYALSSSTVERQTLKKVFRRLREGNRRGAAPLLGNDVN